MISVDLNTKTVKFSRKFDSDEARYRALVNLWWSSPILLFYPFPAETFGGDDVGGGYRTVVVITPLKGWNLQLNDGWRT